MKDGVEETFPLPSKAFSAGLIIISTEDRITGERQTISYVRKPTYVRFKDKKVKCGVYATLS